MAYPKGKPRPPTSGRQKGSRNKKNEAIESITAEIIYDSAYQKNLKRRAINGELAPGLEALLFHYQFGKPVEPNRDEDVFIANLLDIIDKYASSPEAQHEIREVIETYKSGGQALRAVA